MSETASQLSALPSVEALARSSRLANWDSQIKHAVRVRLARQLLTKWRLQVQKGKALPSTEALEDELGARYEALLKNHMQRVINATGVVLHTNLGRAPLGKEMLQSMADELSGYSSLEFDLEKGERGSRSGYVETLLSLLLDVPASLVVNNNAAATFLLLATFAKGKEVILSRGQLVQIGGGYRVPDILAASGATLKEVGTTNMTNLGDYEKAVNEQTGMILEVHQSNFFISGHTECPNTKDLATLSQKKDVLFAVDLGSGLLRKEPWTANEPTVSDTLRDGAELVCFSGDKLLGGPQAGIIVGTKDNIEKLRKSSLYRALRLGKTELYLLEQTLIHYLSERPVPAWECLNEPRPQLESRAKGFVEELKKAGLKAKVLDGTSSVGGGTMPACQLETVLVELAVDNANRFAKLLRKGRPAVVCRQEKNSLQFDLRTVFPEEESILVQNIKDVAAKCSS